MKSLLPLFLIALFISSCANKIDNAKAKDLVASFLNDVKNENYKDIDKYYSSSFNDSEPADKKAEKFNRLKSVMGPIQSWELTSEKENYDSDRGINELELKYRVKCEKLTAEETFLIINDEGKEKIIFQNIENAKP